MAHSLVQTKKGNGGGYVNSLNLTFDSAVTDGSLLILAITYENSHTIGSIADDNGNTWTLVDTAASDTRTVALYYAKDANSGTTQVTVTMGTGEFADIAVIIREYSGIDTTAPLDVSAKGDSDANYVNTISTAATSTPAQANNLVVVAGGSTDSTATWTAGSGYGNLTQQGGSDPYTGVALEDKAISSAAAQAGVLDYSTYAQLSALVVVFKDLAAVNVTVNVGAGGGDIVATNLIPNPAFEVNYTDYWDTFNSSGSPVRSRDTTTKYSGAASYKHDADGVNTDSGLSHNYPSLAAGKYYLSGRLKTSSITGDAKLVMRNTTNDNADINLTLSTATADWTRLSGSYTIVTPITMDVLFGLGPYGAASQGIAWFDEIMLVKSNTDIAYFDGDTPDDADYTYEWAGTAHQSESYKRNVVRGKLTFSLPTPTVTTTTGVVNSVNTLGLTLSQPAPTVTAIRNVSTTASVQTVTASQPTPTVSGGAGVSTNTLSLTASQPTPTVTAVRNVSVSVNSLSITASQQTPTVTAVQNVSNAASVQSGSFSQPTPTISTVRNVSVSVGIQSASFSQPTVGVSAGASVTASVATGAITASQPILTVTAIRNVTVSPEVLSVATDQPTPTITAVRNVTTAQNVLSMTSSQPAATATGIRNVSTSVNVLTGSFATQTPSVSSDQTISIAAEVQSITFNLPAITVTAVQNTSVSANTLSLALTQPTPTVTAIRNVTVQPNALNLSISQPLPTYPSTQEVSVNVNVLSLQFLLGSPTIKSNGWAIPQSNSFASEGDTEYATSGDNAFASDETGDWANNNTTNWGA